MDGFEIKCRGCLKDSGEMKNMAEWGLCEDFYKITDIEVKRSEGITELLCSECEDKLKKCKSFRMQCVRSDLLLRDSVKISKKPHNTDRVAETIGQDIKSQTDLVRHRFGENKVTIQMSPVDLDTKMNLQCPYCKLSFQKRKNLLSHMENRHRASPTTLIELEYYCPYRQCSYYIDSGKWKFFIARKLLNQHLYKVHERQNFACKTCEKTFARAADMTRHTKDCSTTFSCDICDARYKNRESYLVHLLRKHPQVHREYKMRRKASSTGKRSSESVREAKRSKNDGKDAKSLSDYICDSPKRSFATQTFNIGSCVKNDVSLGPVDQDVDRNFSTIETQTVFEDILSMKSQISDEEFFSEVTDIQTQTWPLEFGISRINKETNTPESVTMKETQTCVCLYDFTKGLFDGNSASRQTHTQTQTAEFKSTVSDVMLALNSTETQTCFDDVRTDGL